MYIYLLFALLIAITISWSLSPLEEVSSILLIYNTQSSFFGPFVPGTGVTSECGEPQPRRTYYNIERINAVSGGLYKAVELIVETGYFCIKII